MNVLVAAVGERDCPAARAIMTEGVPCEVIAMRADTDYASTLAEFWRRGEGFVLLEHDVVPWAGALDAIAACEHDWCAYHYVCAPNALMHALGCIRVSDDLVKSHPAAWRGWEDVPWYELDAYVYRALGEATGERYPHFHEPPLAHVKSQGENL